MSNIMKVNFPNHIDRKKIDSTVGDVIIEVFNNYSGDSNVPKIVNLKDLTGDDLDFFCDVIDRLTYPIEAGSNIFLIQKTDKIFNLESSFFRDSEIIPKEGTPVDDGTVLMVRFEIPGFELNAFREIPLYFNLDFNPADLLLLEEIGITITGNGLEFTISNKVDCKVSFSKPETSEVEYIIDFPLFNEIIPADE